MLNPTVLLEQAQLEHAELVRQAEKERLYRRLKANRPGLIRQILNRFKTETKLSLTRTPTAPIPVYGRR